MKKYTVSLAALILVATMMIGVACKSANQVNTYVDLAVSATINGLKLAQSFGANIPQAVLDQVTQDGTLLETAVAQWAAASADQKPGLWAEVEKDLNVFQTNLPSILQAVHVSNPTYAAIVTLAISAIEGAVAIIQAQNPPAGGLKAEVPFDAAKMKIDYNHDMATAGHPELQLK